MEDGDTMDADQAVANSPCHSEARCSETGHKCDLNVTGLKDQMRLSKLLSVITHKHVAKGTCPDQQEDGPGLSDATVCETQKPLRKANFFWQVKNHTEQKGEASKILSDEDGNVSVKANDKEDSLAAGASFSSEPPLKKLKLSNDAFPGVTLSKDRGSAGHHPQHTATACGDAVVTLCGDAGCQLDSSSRNSKPGGKLKEPLMKESEGKSQQSEPALTLPDPSTPSPVGQQRQQTDVFTRWQGRHLAQSMVDNAINATLEVLGFSLGSDLRNPSQAVSAAERQNLEDDAVSVVIQARGLQGTEAGTDISGGRMRGDHLSSPYRSDHLSIPHRSPCSDSSTSATAGHSRHHLENRVIQIPQAMAPSLLEAKEERASLLEPGPGCLHVRPHVEVMHSVVSGSPHRGVGEARDVEAGDLEDLDNFFTPALQTDVLNKAVSAAISQKGLAMDAPL